MGKNIYKKIQEAIEKNMDAALCMVVATQGSTPLKKGAKMIVYEDGKISGTVGGGAFEKGVIENALDVICGKEGGLFEHHLTKDHDMCCGGTMTVYIEKIPLPVRLYVFGAGHVGKELARMAADLDFDVTVIDDRKNIRSAWDLQEVHLMNHFPLEIIPSLAWCNRTFAVIMTHSHALDRKILAGCIKLPTGYLGMIGSARKVMVTKKIFIESGLATNDELNRIDMPIGININAHSPKEIAVSILARLIMERNKHEKRPANVKSDVAEGIKQCV